MYKDLYQQLLSQLLFQVEQEKYLILYLKDEQNGFTMPPPDNGAGGSDYYDIYHQFDFIISPRVHAIGIAASEGIPGVCIQHDSRASTCKGFLTKIIDPKVGLTEAMNILELEIKQIVFNKYSHKLLCWKRKIFDEYLFLFPGMHLPLHSSSQGFL